MHEPTHASPGRGDWLRRKGWLLLTIPLGLTTWAAFVYIAIRAKRPRWAVWAAVYAAGLAVWLTLDTPAHPASGAMAGATVAGLLTWIGGGVHALAISGDAERRMGHSTDPALEAAKLRIERRAEGRKLLAKEPALAKEIGLGRPDQPGSDDYGLIDVNHCPAGTLAELPGIDHALAERIVTQRASEGGFTSVEELEMLLDLPPDTVDEIRDRTVFIPH